ncbi:DUF6344 domain-containing protein [Streptomyces sp. NPDC006339]|uniref:DUF6344 domain-containing protein n=1 Tax=Streptomyces sp. NPDC006339 TaxID=3156755 RepID=UPI0033A5C6EC
MATAKVKQFWTAFVSVLFALLASLGLASPATAAQRTALQQGEEPAATPASAPTTKQARALASVPAQRAAQPWHTARGRALPPTIKQRIRAEAHGSSPSVRHLRADASTEAVPADAFDLAGAALATAGTPAPAGTAAAQAAPAAVPAAHAA